MSTDVPDWIVGAQGSVGEGVPAPLATPAPGAPMFQRARRALTNRALRATGALSNALVYSLNERRLSRR